MLERPPDMSPAMTSCASANITPSTFFVFHFGTIPIIVRIPIALTQGDDRALSYFPGRRCRELVNGAMSMSSCQGVSEVTNAAAM